jgi:hypothetical protein
MTPTTQDEIRAHVERLKKRIVSLKSRQKSVGPYRNAGIELSIQHFKTQLREAQAKLNADALARAIEAMGEKCT